MAVGNIEAIRDWMIGNPTKGTKENWYTIEQINDILACGAIHLYNKLSPYYFDQASEINHIYTVAYYKVNTIPCYYGCFENKSNRYMCSIVLISKEEHGVDYKDGSWSRPTITSVGSFVKNGITWYYAADNGISGNRGSNFVGQYSSIEDAAKALLEVSGHDDML